MFHRTRNHYQAFEKKNTFVFLYFIAPPPLFVFSLFKGSHKLNINTFRKVWSVMYFFYDNLNFLDIWVQKDISFGFQLYFYPKI